MEKAAAAAGGEIGSLKTSLLRIVEEHHQSSLRIRHQTEKAKNDAPRSAMRVSELLVNTVNIGLEESFVNEKRIEIEICALASTVMRYTKQTNQWLAASHALNTALKTDIRSIHSKPNMRYAETPGRFFLRKSDYVESIVRACVCNRGRTGKRVWTPGEKRGMMQRRAFWEILRPRISPPFRCRLCSYSATNTEDARYADVPKPRRRKSERKPYPTPMKVLIRRAKEEKAARKAEPCRILQPPENGLLVPELVHVARRVNQARESLLDGLSKLAGAVIPVKRCRYCSEVHIGHVGHEIRTCSGAKNGLRSSTHVWRTGCLADMVRFPYCYHLHDRVGKPRVGHDERFQVKRLPAVLELCIQAGLDHEDYPTRRRTKPVYSIEGRIVDFEPEMEHEDVEGAPQAEDPLLSFQSDGGNQNSWHYEENSNELSVKTLESWLEMRSGAELMMKTYSVKTCGYCPEVQVGPKGHKVRMCKAARHQFRNGLHAWQEATIDDLIWPNYVWHVRDPHGPTLANELKRYYGKAPAVVELCVQAGAPVPDEYRSMMRLDVVSPNRDEVDLVA